jgi:hypothetical protein
MLKFIKKSITCRSYPLKLWKVEKINNILAHAGAILEATFKFKSRIW